MIRLGTINSQIVKPNMEDTNNIVQALKRDLFSIEPIVAEVDRALLGLAYTPGVGAVCLDIQKEPALADRMTFRRRAVAVVSDGSCLDSEGHRFMPVMDWFVVQIKHYCGLDAFPFVISRQTDMDSLILDLATTYGTVLYLDSRDISFVPDNLLLVRQQEIANYAKTDLTDARPTVHALSYLVGRGQKGSLSHEDVQTATAAPLLKHVVNNSPFTFVCNDNNENARLFHTQYEGKIRVVNHVEDFEQLRTVFTEKNLREVVKL